VLVAQVDFRVAAADTAAAQSLASKLDATSLNTALENQVRRPVLASPWARVCSQRVDVGVSSAGPSSRPSCLAGRNLYPLHGAGVHASACLTST
jgi:hypothetical protein